MHIFSAGLNHYYCRFSFLTVYSLYMCSCEQTMLPVWMFHQAGWRHTVLYSTKHRRCPLVKTRSKLFLSLLWCAVPYECLSYVWVWVCVHMGTRLTQGGRFTPDAVIFLHLRSPSLCSCKPNSFDCAFTFNILPPHSKLTLGFSSCFCFDFVVSRFFCEEG